jgi:hypothetical protein
VPFVDVPMHRVAKEGSPELRRRVARPCRTVRRPRRILASRTTLDGFAVARATSRCKAHSKSRSPARNRGTLASSPKSSAIRRHRPSPTAAYAHACVLSR